MRGTHRRTKLSEFAIPFACLAVLGASVVLAEETLVTCTCGPTTVCGTSTVVCARNDCACCRVTGTIPYFCTCCTPTFDCLTPPAGWECSTSSQ